MNIDTMSMAVSLLVSDGIHATVEYPGTIHVINGTSNYIFGTVNPTFDADVFNLPEAFTQGADPDHSIQTDLSSECDDPVLVAHTIAKVVSPDQPHSFICAHCGNILNPGDTVVFHQDSETNIEVFCSDACKYEENPATALKLIKAVATELKVRGFEAKMEYLYNENECWYPGYIEVGKYGMRFTFGRGEDQLWEGEVEAERSSGVVTVEQIVDCTDIPRITDALVKAMKACTNGVTTPDLPAQSWWVFNEVVKDMDEAENIYGPKDINEYVRLMKAILAEATQRINNAESWHTQKTMYAYFADKLGESPRDESLKELDLDTPCGQSCKTAIDSAAAFLFAVDSSLRDDIIAVANNAVEIFWRG